jgi:hypothetical protein
MFDVLLSKFSFKSSKSNHDLASESLCTDIDPDFYEAGFSSPDDEAPADLESASWSLLPVRKV